MEPAPAAKRRTVSAAALPAQPAPPMPERSTATASERAPFQFWYLDHNKRVLNRVDAETSWCLDGTEMLRMKIGYPISQATHPLAAQLFGSERRGDVMVAEMREDTADLFPQCTAFAEVRKAAPAPKAPNLSALLAEEKVAQKRASHTVDPSRQLPGYLHKGSNAVASGSRDTANASDMRLAAAKRSYSNLSQVSRASSPPASQLTASPSTSVSSSPVRPPRPTRPIIRAATATTASSSSSGPNLHRTASAPLPLHTHARPRLSHAVPGLAPVEHPSIYTPLTDFPEFAPYVFKAGQYAIELALDHREKGKNDRDAIANGLSKKGVPVNNKYALELGDVVWVARAATGEECVLDVVLERKRLDDLVQSIKDKRFHEQKFRLHQSGISSVLYLVEAYDTQKQREGYAVQIDTALSSTQVVDGFLVKETKHMNDTIAYLANLTEELIREHTMKNLYVIPPHMIRRHSYVDLQKHLRHKYPDRCYVTSYADFQALNSKSAYTTVRDTWARMLLCVKGMSAEKVGAVVERWDTPRALWEAFREAQEKEEEALAWEAADAGAAGSSKGKGKKKSAVPEARMMLQGVGGSEGGVRAIGPTLSTKLYDLFMSEDYEEE
ncbi:ERCC4 domain-containing protein [Mycena polygramma]|nr:ERCC4 domain-containing protein [Mycena polygramma]